MKTNQPISTISYNTTPFLKSTLERLVKQKILSFATWIEHKPEEDENKPHKHVYMIPSKSIQTDDLRDLFAEIDPNNVKPLGVMPFQKSKFEDWYLYGIHDKAYLARHGQCRKYHYEPTDVKSNDEDYLQQLVREIQITNPLLSHLREVVDGKESLPQLMAMGVINPLQAQQVEKALNLMKYGSTFRNGREGHEHETPMAYEKRMKLETENNYLQHKNNELNMEIINLKAEITNLKKQIINLGGSVAYEED